MKCTPRAYARALLGAEGKHEGVVARFLALVEKNGDARKLPIILEYIEREAARERGDRYVVVTSARPLSKKHLSELQAKFSERDTVRTEVDPSLIAGVRVTVDGEWVVDASLERKLRKLFTETASSH
jgi:F0F1-type ATP synthase delta subunit